MAPFSRRTGKKEGKSGIMESCKIFLMWSVWWILGIILLFWLSIRSWRALPYLHIITHYQSISRQQQVSRSAGHTERKRTQTNKSMKCAQPTHSLAALATAVSEKKTKTKTKRRVLVVRVARRVRVSMIYNTTGIYSGSHWSGFWSKTDNIFYPHQVPHVRPQVWKSSYNKMNNSTTI